MIKKNNVFIKFFLLSLLILISACAAIERPDYSSYKKHMPKSILVLPPLNQSNEVNAPYTYLSTISRPLAECGYYVYPVAVIDTFLKENGLPTPGEMHSISLNKIREIIGADAVLYVTIEDWGQKYRVFSSDTVVKARARLVDVVSGETIWSGAQNAVQNSGGGSNGIIGMLISAAINQIISSTIDQTFELSRQANYNMVFNNNNGLLWGPYNNLNHEIEICSH